MNTQRIAYAAWTDFSEPCDGAASTAGCSRCRERTGESRTGRDHDRFGTGDIQQTQEHQ